jgi:hypothetical protein
MAGIRAVTMRGTAATVTTIPMTTTVTTITVPTTMTTITVPTTMTISKSRIGGDDVVGDPVYRVMWWNG